IKNFPAVHYERGGLWVDDDQMTYIACIYAEVECDYSEHGGNRNGANSLLSSIYGGMVAGPNAIDYIDGVDTHVTDMAPDLFEKSEKIEQEKLDAQWNMRGKENA